MIRPRIRFEEKNDEVMKRLLREMPKLRGSYVSIGFHEGAGEYDDGTSVVEVALWNEFGTKDTPQRSFIRSTLEEHSDQINRWREEAMVAIVEKGVSTEKALESLGFKLQVLIQNKIKSNVPPPNAESTREHKKREGVPQRTLIETGLMLRSVSYRVVVK